MRVKRVLAGGTSAAGLETGQRAVTGGRQFARLPVALLIEENGTYWISPRDMPSEEGYYGYNRRRGRFEEISREELKKAMFSGRYDWKDLFYVSFEAAGTASNSTSEPVALVVGGMDDFLAHGVARWIMGNFDGVVGVATVPHARAGMAQRTIASIRRSIQ